MVASLLEDAKAPHSMLGLERYRVIPNAKQPNHRQECRLTLVGVAERRQTGLPFGARSRLSPV